MNMLTHIQIQYLATIEDLNLDLAKGTTAITGETGAGKSILIDAIELALGARASSDFVRPGHDKADISILFDIKKLPEVQAWLQTYDLESDNKECVIRRVINKDGRSRSYINNFLTTNGPLRELSELLINIHGQHENQSLLKSDKQRDILDKYASHYSLVNNVFQLAEKFNALTKEFILLSKLTEERQQRSDFLKFQIDELAELKMTPDEFSNLDLEHKQLSHSDELIQNLNLAINLLSANDETNVMSVLNQIIHALENIKRVDAKINTWIDTLKNCIIQLSDTDEELQRYLGDVEIDPQRLLWLEDRISKLFNMARKHKISPNELCDLQNKLTQEFNDLANSDQRLATLQQEIDSTKQEYEIVAVKLTKSREKSAKKLLKEVNHFIHQLALPHAEFDILFEKENTVSIHGAEKISFLIKTNQGLDFHPLAKIASGGELSRISLAIHTATAEQHTIPVLIFDEVDVGISGAVAEMVGTLLKKLGETHQVLCITHSPQVASKAHQHLLVEKLNVKNSTLTQIRVLTREEKIDELARMIGGVKMTEATLARAREMIVEA